MALPAPTLSATPAYPHGDILFEQLFVHRPSNDCTPTATRHVARELGGKAIIITSSEALSQQVIDMLGRIPTSALKYARDKEDDETDSKWMAAGLSTIAKEIVQKKYPSAEVLEKQALDGEVNFSVDEMTRLKTWIAFFAGKPVMCKLEVEKHVNQNAAFKIAEASAKESLNVISKMKVDNFVKKFFTSLANANLQPKSESNSAASVLRISLVPPPRPPKPFTLTISNGLLSQNNLFRSTVVVTVSDIAPPRPRKPNLAIAVPSNVNQSAAAVGNGEQHSPPPPNFHRTTLIVPPPYTANANANNEPPSPPPPVPPAFTMIGPNERAFGNQDSMNAQPPNGLRPPPPKPALPPSLANKPITEIKAVKK